MFPYCQPCFGRQVYFSLTPDENISPFAVSPDGRVWSTNFWSSSTSVYGLRWIDGTNFGIFPQQQTGGLPHAQIYDIEVKNIQNGYELWISCASRGIAVLTVETSVTNQEDDPDEIVILFVLSRLASEGCNFLSFTALDFFRP